MVEIHPLKISEIEEVESRREGFCIPIATFYIADFMFITDESEPIHD